MQVHPLAKWTLFFSAQWQYQLVLFASILVYDHHSVDGNKSTLQIIHLVAIALEWCAKQAFSRQVALGSHPDGIADHLLVFPLHAHRRANSD
jgi:hypothetical protein